MNSNHAFLPRHPTLSRSILPIPFRPNSLVNVLGSNQFSEDVVPTVAFNLRQVRKGNVTLKIWDVAVRTRSLSMASLIQERSELDV